MLMEGENIQKILIGHKNDSRLSMFSHIQIVLIFCYQLPIAESSDFEVQSVYTEFSTGKVTMCVFDPNSLAQFV